jgi:hypothetical protein
MVNWDPPTPQDGMEAGAGSDDPTMTEHGIYVPGHQFAIFIQGFFPREGYISILFPREGYSNIIVL